MKVLIFVPIAIMFCMPSSVPTSLAYGDDQAEVHAIAVLPFKERGRETQDLGAQVSDLLFANLIARPELFLVERQDIQRTFEELELNQSGVVASPEAVQVGHLTGARILITGSVLNVNDSLYIIAKIIGTETTRVIGASVKGSRRDALDDMVETLSDDIVKAIARNSDRLVARPISQDDRVAALRRQLGKADRPRLLIRVTERHVGRAAVDPAAETELMLYCTETGFDVLDPDGAGRDPDIRLIGEGLTEFATRHGNLISVKARLEVRAVDEQTGEVIAIDRETSIHVDLTEQLAGKTALQKASAAIAERLLPRIVERFDGDRSKPQAR